MVKLVIAEPGYYAYDTRFDSIPQALRELFGDKYKVIQPFDTPKIGVICFQDQSEKKFNRRVTEDGIHIVYTYDDNGNIIGEKTYLHSSYYSEQTYAYDSHGNKIEENLYNFNGIKYDSYLYTYVLLSELNGNSWDSETLNSNPHTDAANTKPNTGVIAEMYAQIISSANDSQNLSNHQYALFDLTKDGIGELIIHTGTCEQDRKYEIYMYQSGEVNKISEFNAWHAGLYTDETGTLIYSSGGQMIQTAYKILFNGESVFTEDIMRNESVEEYRTWSGQITWFDFSNMTLINQM